MRARAQITSASLDLRYGEEVEIDETDEVWQEALRDGFLVPLDDTVLGASVPDGEWKPGTGGKKAKAATKKAAVADEAPPDEDPPES